MMTSQREAGYHQRKLERGCDAWSEFCTKSRDLLPEKKKKKKGKEELRGYKACEERFGRNDFLIKDMKAFCLGFFICIFNRKSLTLVLQWNSVWCWWNDNWAITKIHEHFPMENSHKVYCFSQIHESVKAKAL